MIGQRLKEERERLALSQTDFAALVNAAKRTQIEWEKDNSSPSAAQLNLFFQAGVDIQYVVTGIRSTVALSPDERLLVERYRLSAQPLRDAALRVVLGASSGLEGAATQNFQGATISGGVAARDIINESKSR
jgi:transcriptional regulator with XRE-family HTH domain